MEEEIEGLLLETKVEEEIAAKVAELKAADKNLRAVYPIVVEGVEGRDAKDMYIAYFKEPSFVAFSKYLSVSQNNSMPVAMRALAKDCFVDGDRELVDDDSLFLFGLMGQLSKIIEMRNGKLVNLLSPRK
jgi:hypothetical protein